MSKQLEVELPYSPTDIKVINEQFGGGIPRRILSALSGEFEAGKTIMTIQLAWNFLAWAKSEGIIANALIIDTEGPLANFGLPGWKPKFDKRYNISPTIVKIEIDDEAWEKRGQFVYKLIPEKFKSPVIFVLDVRDIFKMLSFLGYPITLKLNESGKVTVRPDVNAFVRGEYPKIQESLIGRLCQEYSIRFIAIDSISSIPEDVFIGGEVNFPGRKDASAVWFGRLQQLAERYDAVVLGTHKMSKNDTNKFDIGAPLGGKAVKHAFKFVLLFERFKNPMTGQPAMGGKKNPRAYYQRKVFRGRHQYLPAGKPAGYKVIDLAENGWVDVEVVVPEGDLVDE